MRKKIVKKRKTIIEELEEMGQDELKKELERQLKLQEIKNTNDGNQLIEKIISKIMKNNKQFLFDLSDDKRYIISEYVTFKEKIVFNKTDKIDKIIKIIKKRIIIMKNNKDFMNWHYLPMNLLNEKLNYPLYQILTLLYDEKYFFNLFVIHDYFMNNHKEICDIFKINNKTNDLANFIFFQSPIKRLKIIEYLVTCSIDTEEIDLKVSEVLQIFDIVLFLKIKLLNLDKLVSNQTSINSSVEEKDIDVIVHLKESKLNLNEYFCEYLLYCLKNDFYDGIFNLI